AVGRRLGDNAGPDAAARPALVFDNNRYAVFRLKMLAKYASDQIRRAPGQERNDDGDGWGHASWPRAMCGGNTRAAAAVMRKFRRFIACSQLIPSAFRWRCSGAGSTCDARLRPR